MTSRQVWLLFALAHRNGKPMTPAQIQKAMFLMSAEASALVDQPFYKFVPYNYGPFDAQVYHDLDSLSESGCVAATHFPGRSWKLYAITPAGLDAARRVKLISNKQGVSYLEKVVDWVSSLSFPEARARDLCQISAI